ncbi:hypothetical protein DP939_05010 [Spongiactinospora rosea]|uniref:LPXTG-motif cell wall-anchored protein n=1 Tax=Spongiactinospora rosea TaxID=2248750 RepID=A0A366M784_9ACTN|nr:hypothetical protein DP939_05010 [Spongiactinospora rosea]
MSALSLVGGGLFAISSTPAQANTVGVDLDYNCTGGIGQGTKLRVTVTAPTTMTVGQPIGVKWNIAYHDQTAFTSPSYLAPQSKLSAKGALQIEGPWSGNTSAGGSLDQWELKKGDRLKLPSLDTGKVGATEPGEIRITPGDLVVDFTPAEGEKAVDDDELPLGAYEGTWRDVAGRDVHETTARNASVSLKFLGTGVDFITEKDQQPGNLKLEVDGVVHAPEVVDPPKGGDGALDDGPKVGGHRLWKVRDLSYNEHTVKVTNLEDGKSAVVDAFRVVTPRFEAPPDDFRSTCSPDPKNVTLTINIGEKPPTTPPPNPGDNGNNNGGQNGNGNGNGGQSTATTTATATVTASPSPVPTNTRTVTATATPQVQITPVGAPQTGESPAPPSGGALIGAGSAMLVGAIMGGVALRRRRAAHAGAGR